MVGVFSGCWNPASVRNGAKCEVCNRPCHVRWRLKSDMLNALRFLEARKAHALILFVPQNDR
jgi:hypothetical protein